jgi:hypothetical protein
MFLKIEIYHYHYVISGYHGYELSGFNMVDERKLCCRSRMNELSFVTVRRVYSVSTDTIMMWICEVQCTI